MNRTYATERKLTKKEGRQIEEQSVEAQRHMFVGYWEWNLETKKYGWCDEMYRIFNLKPQQFPLRTGTFFNHVHHEDRKKVVKALGKALVGAQPYNIEHRILWPDGSVRFVHGKAEVTFDEAGRPISIRGTVQDITDRQKVTCPPKTDPHVKLEWWIEGRQGDEQEALHTGADHRKTLGGRGGIVLRQDT